MNGNSSYITATDVENWIAARLGKYVNITTEAVSRDANFDSFGIDSARAIELMIDLQEWLQVPDELPHELLFEADSIRDAAAQIVVAVEKLNADETARHLS